MIKLHKFNDTLNSPPSEMEQLVMNIQLTDQQRGIHLLPHSNALASQSNKILDKKPNPEEWSPKEMKYIHRHRIKRFHSKIYTFNLHFLFKF